MPADARPHCILHARDFGMLAHVFGAVGQSLATPGGFSIFPSVFDPGA
jgi:hypothetical protein